MADYTNKCGSCVYFTPITKDGMVMKRGSCSYKTKQIYHDASQKACKKYKQKIIDEAIPTIMPEIEYRKAHWQNNACSNCGIYNASAYKNWCPNCGCQMTEETE